MITGTTSSGFAFSMDERVLEDWRFLQAIADIDSEDGTRVVTGTTNIAELVLGKEGTKKLQEHIMKDNDGFVPAQLVQKEIIEIINQSKETKKSLSSPG